MGSIDGRPNLSLEGENGSSQKKPMTKSQREKRKSEVLIAAQSIENEVQSVKSLKRISIGSIDLLIDPEMEFRVNSPNARKSWSSNSSSSGEEADIGRVSSRENDSNLCTEVDDDTVGTEGPETSFDVTGTDYLQSSDSTHDGPDLINSSSYSQRSDSPQRSVRRILTGVGSLRRGGVNTAGNDDSASPPANDGSSGAGNSSLTKQLFWVPANQHPNVKPENYLELVQDTLHNIQLDDKDDKLDSNSGKKNTDISGFERLPIDLARKRDSLVRRPSRLRKSYTEFEEYNEDEDGDENRQKNHHKVSDQPKAVKQSSKGSRRAVSLKDITEELNKISNKAGLTSSDAITLARTLSMAGTYSNTDVESEDNYLAQNEQRSLSGDGQSSGKNEGESEFASNMLTKHGVVIPARSSLRRSKFNTYRIRSSGSASSMTDDDATAERRPALETKEETKTTSENKMNIHTEGQQNRIDSVSSIPPSAKQPESTVSSPSTINDFQDIYDHYRQSSVDWGKELGKELPEQPVSQSYKQSDDEEIPAVKPQPSIQDGKLLNAGPVGETQEELAAIPGQNNSEKKTGWSWLNGITNRDSVTGKQAKADSKPLPSSQNDVSNDFDKVSDQTGVQSEKPGGHRINHSKNRHLPIFSVSDTAKPDHSSTEKDEEVFSKQTLLSAVDSSNLKRQKFEKKFVNLFKRKVKSKSAANKSSKDVVNVDTPTSSPSDIQPDSGKLNRNFVKLKSESGAEEHLRTSQSSTRRISSGDEDRWISQEVETDELPALQPAVSVTSTKSNHLAIGEPAVVESVRELDGDDSQDVSGDISANSGIDLMQEAIVMKEQANDGQANGNTILPASKSHVAPPRKLTFADVKRPDRPNAAMNFTDSAFGFPLPMLTVSTVIMFDHRLPINVERAIYRLSHLKLSDPKRELRQQVILSNFMYAYLNLVNHTLYMEQVAQDNDMNSSVIVDSTSSSAAYKTEHNSANGSICIPDI